MPANDWTLSNCGQFIAGMAQSTILQSNSFVLKTL